MKWPTLRIFKKILPQIPTLLAHAIAAQTHRDIKAMARAKSTTQDQKNWKDSTAGYSCRIRDVKFVIFDHAHFSFWIRIRHLHLLPPQ